MLVLTRKKDEIIVLEIGGIIVNLHVRRIQGSRVLLGVEAPREVSVRRAELKSKDQDQEGK